MSASTVQGWHTGRLMSFDVESSGVDVFNDRIVTAAVICVGSGLATTTSEWLINPGIEIPAEATAIHGITNEKAATGEPAAEAIDCIAANIALNLRHGIPLVGMNASFDLSMLEAECARYEIPTVTERLGRPIGPVIDPFVLDKHLYRFRKGKRTLTVLADAYGCPIPEGAAHGAVADALAAARVVWRIGQVGASHQVFTHLGLKDDLYPGFAAVSAMSLDELHAAQIGWAKDQADSLRDYFRKQKETAKAATVDGSWPVRYPAAAAAAVAS